MKLAGEASPLDPPCHVRTEHGPHRSPTCHLLLLSPPTTEQGQIQDFFQMEGGGGVHAIVRFPEQDVCRVRLLRTRFEKGSVLFCPILIINHVKAQIKFPLQKGRNE